VKTSIRLDQIRTDGGTQPRAAIDFDAVDDYTDAMVGGARFPPIVVFYDGTDYWLADGFHRVKAADQAGLDTIACDVRQGTQQDAQWYSYGANKAHGQRRTNDDKQRAVDAALRHPKAAKLSTRRIAEHCGVSHMMVQRWRDQISASVTKLQMPGRTVTRGGRTYHQDTSNIGRRPQSNGAAPASPVPVNDQEATIFIAPTAGLAGDNPATSLAQPIQRSVPISGPGKVTGHSDVLCSRTPPSEESNRNARNEIIGRLVKDASKQLNGLIEICGWLSGGLYQDYIDDIQTALEQVIEILDLTNDRINKRADEEDSIRTAALLKGVEALRQPGRPSKGVA
jgi:hypothetical protein